MLKTEQQVALDTVINSSCRSIEHYRWVADSSDDERIRTSLDNWARQRQSIVDKLAPQMYKLGDMPSFPDPEKVAVEEMLTQIKAAFSKDEKKVLLTDLDELDAQLLGEIADACRLGFDEETLALLRELQESVIAAKEARVKLSA